MGEGSWRRAAPNRGKRANNQEWILSNHQPTLNSKQATLNNKKDALLHLHCSICIAAFALLHCHCSIVLTQLALLRSHCQSCVAQVSPLHLHCKLCTGQIANRKVQSWMCIAQFHLLNAHCSTYAGETDCWRLLGGADIVMWCKNACNKSTRAHARTTWIDLNACCQWSIFYSVALEWPDEMYGFAILGSKLCELHLLLINEGHDL